MGCRQPANCGRSPRSLDCLPQNTVRKERVNTDTLQPDEDPGSAFHVTALTRTCGAKLQSPRWLSAAIEIAPRERTQGGQLIDLRHRNRVAPPDDERTVADAAIAAGADAVVLKRCLMTDLLPAVDALRAGRRYVSPDLSR